MILNNIKDNSSHYLCEKSLEWIDNNRELINKAENNRKLFAKLIKQLEVDAKLYDEKKVLVYRLLGINQRFSIGYDADSFGEIYELDTFDDF